jgi:hypothetical protein
MRIRSRRGLAKPWVVLLIKRTRTR